MQASAYEGYFSNGLFYTMGRTVQIPEKRRIFITILEETVHETEYKATEQKESEQEWLDDFFNILSTATNEIDEKYFPRICFRKPDELFIEEANL